MRCRTHGAISRGRGQAERWGMFIASGKREAKSGVKA